MVQLDHLMVPARDKVASAKLLAELLGVPWSETGVGPFAPVFVNDGFTIDFDEWSEPLPMIHYCFRVSPGEFDAILGRIRAAGIPYRSAVHGPVDYEVDDAHGGRIVYWNVPDGHQWEMLTESYARNSQQEGKRRMSTRKKIAADFLTMVCSGKVREAYDRYIAPDFRHHNGYFPGDRQSLLDAMDENARENPGKAVEVRRALEEGDTVVTFSHMKPEPEHAGFAIVHIFRFDGDKIVELWDVAQEVPKDSPNRNGMF